MTTMRGSNAVPRASRISRAASAPERMILAWYIHVPKTGGTSVEEAFKPSFPKNHALATLDLVSTGTTSTGRDALLAGLKESTANPYLVIFAEGLPHFQATSWGEKGKPNAP